MEDTATEPAYFAVIAGMAESDYLAVIDDTCAPEHAAALDDAARNPMYHETVENTIESTGIEVFEVFSKLKLF